MKKSDKKSINSCNQVEQLLIQNNIEKLNESEIQLIHNHIDSCKGCQKYHTKLETLYNSVKIDQNEKLIPEPMIRINILRKMKRQKLVRITISEMVWNVLKKTLAYRIPVYQAAIGGVSIVVILFLINNLPTILERDFSYQQRYNETSPAIQSQANVMENFDILDQQKIGRNVQEDTLLTKFITTVM